MKVLEFNVHMGGGFAFVKNLIMHSNSSITMDIAALNPLEDETNILLLKKYNTNIFVLGRNCNVIIKRIVRLIDLIKLLNREKYECIHIHADVASICFYYGLAAKLFGIKKIIFHSHSTGVAGKYTLIRKILNYTFKPLLKYIGTDFLACSNDASKWMFVGIKNVKIIKNGIDLDLYKNDFSIRNNCRKKLGFDVNERVIGHVGRFSNEKNHRFIINLLVELSKVSNIYKLILIGDGELKQEIVEYAESKGVYDNIIFTGNVNNVQDYMQAMDLFILPSQFEGLPLSGVEAQACGLPVIFSTGVPKEAKITDNVKFIPTDNMDEWIKSVEEMITSPKLDNTQLIKSSGYDIKQTAEEIERIYLS